MATSVLQLRNSAGDPRGRRYTDGDRLAAYRVWTVTARRSFRATSVLTGVAENTLRGWAVEDGWSARAAAEDEEAAESTKVAVLAGGGGRAGASRRHAGRAARRGDQRTRPARRRARAPRDRRDQSQARGGRATKEPAKPANPTSATRSTTGTASGRPGGRSPPRKRSCGAPTKGGSARNGPTPSWRRRWRCSSRGSPRRPADRLPPSPSRSQRSGG